MVEIGFQEKQKMERLLMDMGKFQINMSYLWWLKLKEDVD